MTPDVAGTGVFVALGNESAGSVVALPVALVTPSEVASERRGSSEPGKMRVNSRSKLSGCGWKMTDSPMAIGARSSPTAATRPRPYDVLRVRRRDQPLSGTGVSWPRPRRPPVQARSSAEEPCPARNGRGILCGRFDGEPRTRRRGARTDRTPDRGACAVPVRFPLRARRPPGEGTRDTRPGVRPGTAPREPNRLCTRRTDGCGGGAWGPRASAPRPPHSDGRCDWASRSTA